MENDSGFPFFSLFFRCADKQMPEVGDLKLLQLIPNHGKRAIESDEEDEVEENKRKRAKLDKAKFNEMDKGLEEARKKSGNNPRVLLQNLQAVIETGKLPARQFDLLEEFKQAFRDFVNDQDE